MSNRTSNRRLGGDWLEWRWIRKGSGAEFGRYLYYRWREDGRKRTRYLGKVNGDGTSAVACVRLIDVAKMQMRRADGRSRNTTSPVPLLD